MTYYYILNDNSLPPEERKILDIVEYDNTPLLNRALLFYRYKENTGRCNWSGDVDHVRKYYELRKV